MIRWFIADLHLGHERGFSLTKIRTRHFSSMKEWTNMIIENTNKVVAKRDQLFLLGDFAAKDIAYWKQRFKGDLWLIKGNHDPSTRQCKKVFGSQVRDTFMTKLDKNPCWLSHYPHAFWPKSHYGSYHLYGHMHGQREDFLNEMMPQRRSLDVCPEVIFEIIGEWRPISEFEILEYLKDREGHDPVEYYHQLRCV